MAILCFVSRKLRPENTRSASVLVAGTHRYLVASLARLGYLEEEQEEEQEEEEEENEYIEAICYAL